MRSTELDNLSPYVRVALDSVIQAPWILSERVILDYELLFVKGGRVIITVEDTVYTGAAGDIFLFKPGQRHTIRTSGPEPFRQPHIHFDLFQQPDSPSVKVSFKPLAALSETERRSIRYDVTSGPDLVLPNKIVLPNTRYFEDLLMEIIRTAETRAIYHELELKGLFIRLWAYLLREIELQANPALGTNLDTLEKIKLWLAGHCTREVALEELAGEFHISKYHLIRLFRQAYRLTPIEYHRRLRLARIKEMIQFSDLSLTEIAEKAGFRSIHAFSRAFARAEGVPPTFYRGRASRGDCAAAAARQSAEDQEPGCR